jgi:hypothetical protein
MGMHGVGLVFLLNDPKEIDKKRRSGKNNEEKRFPFSKSPTAPGSHEKNKKQ